MRQSTSIKIDPALWRLARHQAVNEGITVSEYIESLIGMDVKDAPPQDDFSLRDEANAITALALRNGFLEELHAGKHSPLLDDASLSRIRDVEMKKLMVEASAKIEELLRLREDEPERYRTLLKEYGRTYCHSWTRTGKTVDIATGSIRD